MTQQFPAPTVHEGKLIWEASDLGWTRWPRWFEFRGQRFEHSSTQRRDGDVTAVCYAGDRGTVAVVFND